MRKKKVEKTSKELPVATVEELVIEPVMENAPIKGTVGYELNKARERKKKDLEKIAAQLRIRPRYLEALEQSKYMDFPGQAYAFGFLRTYSDFLGLNTEELVIRYRQERAFIKPEKLEMPIPQKQELLPYAKHLLWSILIIALIWAFWYFITYSQIKEAPLTGIQQNAITLKSKEQSEKKDILPKSGSDKKEPVKIEEKQSQKEESRIKIVANQDVWVEISQNDSLVYSKTMKKSESYDVPAKSDNMFLKTGNAAGIDVFVDGKKIKSLGPSGSVRSKISLAADKLKNL